MVYFFATGFCFFAMDLVSFSRGFVFLFFAKGLRIFFCIGFCVFVLQDVLCLFVFSLFLCFLQVLFFFFDCD